MVTVGYRGLPKVTNRLLKVTIDCRLAAESWPEGLTGCRACFGAPMVGCVKKARSARRYAEGGSMKQLVRVIK